MGDVLLEDGGVEAVERDDGVRLEASDASGEGETEAGGGVHG